MRFSLLQDAQLLTVGRISLPSIIDKAAPANIRRRMRMEAIIRKLNSLLGDSAHLPEAARVEKWRRDCHDGLWLPIYSALAQAAGVEASQEFLKEFTSFAARAAEGCAADAYLADLTTDDPIDFARIYGGKLSGIIKSYIGYNLDVRGLL
ncbi:hypothetical protein V6U77_17965 [Micromonospora sp. CPCC 205546]|uniref:hypothetical protein n=1 Tax=Micromonospora sp. CPCC 205546 TaxID=3122397 RepID=UPI002FF35514